MDRSPARPQFHRCCRLCGCGFKRLGNTTGAGTRIAFGDWRAIRLGAFRFPNLGCLLYVGSDVGRVHRRPKTVAKWHLFAIHNSYLVNCSGNRFRSPLTHRGKGGRTQNDSSGELIGEKSPITLIDRGRKCCPELFLHGARARLLHKTQGAGHPNLILIG